MTPDEYQKDLNEVGGKLVEEALDAAALEVLDPGAQMRTALALKRLRQHGKVPQFVPPGIRPRVETDAKGKPVTVYRKVWIDRDKYSRVNPMKELVINARGNQEDDQARDPAEQAQAEGPAFGAVGQGPG